MAGDGLPRSGAPHRLSLRSAEGSAFDGLRGAVGAWQGGGTALKLAASALEDGTVEQYGRNWELYCTWCDLNDLDPIPSTPTMIFAYVGWLAERGTIAASSLQPYLSAINSYHADLGLERPALGHLVHRARQGMARGQTLVQTRDTRVPLPAQVVLRALEDTLAQAAQQQQRLKPREYAAWLRSRYALCLAFVFFGRQDSCVGLLSVDHGIDGEHLWLRLTEKMRRRWAFRRVVRLPLRCPPTRGHASALPRLARLGQLYLRARQQLPGKAPERLFQLPREAQPTAARMSEWVADVLKQLGVAAPAGFAYKGHSLRSGGSSAAEAIGVSRYRGNWLGGWSQTSKTRELHYIDPSVPPTPAAYALLGWLLDASYDAEAAVWMERRATTPDAGEE